MFLILEHFHRKPETIFFMGFSMLVPVNTEVSCKESWSEVSLGWWEQSHASWPRLGASEFQPVDSMINWSKILKHSYTCVYTIYSVYIYILVIVIEYIFWLVVQSILYFVEMAWWSPFFRLAKPPTVTMDSFWLDPMRAFSHCNYNTVPSSIYTASVTHRS